MKTITNGAALAFAVADLVQFIERHKAALIGNECTAEEYEAAVKPAVKAVRDADPGLLSIITSR
jgi:hypothetical protein